VEVQFYWSWLGFFESTMSNTDSKPSWKCNFCGKITLGNNHTRVSFFIFILYLIVSKYSSMCYSILKKRNLDPCFKVPQDIKDRMDGILVAKSSQKQLL
jgi:hypothetical protein